MGYPERVRIALDATYSIGENLSGIGVYSREILYGLAAAHPEIEFRFCYRPHRLLESFSGGLPANARRSLLHGPFAPSSALFHALNQRLPNTRIRRSVTTFHDLFVITGEYSTAEFRDRFKAQARDAAARSDLIISVSAFTAGQVERCLGIERSRIRVIHHGVRPPADPPPPTEARQRIVLHVGAIQKRKNLARLIKAFETLGSGWTLVLAGSLGFEGEKLLDAIHASTARSRILAPGYVSASELASLYARAALFAFPSLDEGFGMPVLEAMAWGVPVVTSTRSALPEVAGDAAVLADPEDTDALAHALQSVAGNEDFQRELRDRGLRRAAQFTWEDSVSKTWAVYSELI